MALLLCWEGDTQALKFVGERYWPRTEVSPLQGQDVVFRWASPE